MPGAKTVSVSKGATLLNAAVKAGVYLHSSCGGNGTCGRCRVIVKSGDCKAEESAALSDKEKKRGYKLACMTSVYGDMTVEVPASSAIDLEGAVPSGLKGLFKPTEDTGARPLLKEDVYSHSPLATKVFLHLPKPDLDDAVSDLERLFRQIRKDRKIGIMQTGLVNIKKLGSLLRENDWKVTATLGNRNMTTEIVKLEPRDTSGKNFGIAFDIGTTTISGQLVDLNTRGIMGTKSAYNRQVTFGDDVITRILYASEEGGLEKLHRVVADTMNSIVRELAGEHGLDLNDINGAACAGNTTMIHLLLRVDPRFIRREPYVSIANFVPVIRAAEAGLKISPRGLLYCAPGVSTYVGGDITAGVLACGLDTADELTMLVDVGTNGEIVIGNSEWMASCSASAGPAFEGSGLASGIRAQTGAIEGVSIDSDANVALETIGKAPPKGICGSGYINLLAGLLDKGIITKDGKLDERRKSARIRRRGHTRAFTILEKGESGAPEEITVTEEDIENLKRSKGAIYSAISVLLNKLGLGYRDIKRIYLAGGFGSSLNVRNAVSIGLLPDIEAEKIRFVGNTALAGSCQTLLSYEAMKAVEEIARKITYVELSAEKGYMEEYVSSLFFPHTDESRFPSAARRAGA